jgi:hypothetical protein
MYSKLRLVLKENNILFLPHICVYYIAEANKHIEIKVWDISLKTY